ncbi:MAG: glycosyltransferase family 4 protein [Clostridia bacterium]|nr:glycosyltransferase family 4 protein [Clostridia bacterium]
MQKKVLLVATVQSHIGQFHKPLMQLLKEHGWEIHVAARDNLAEKNGLQLEYPDKVFNIPFQRSPFDRRNIVAYKQLKEVLAENHYDIIHCNTPVGGILGRLAGNKYRKTGTQVYYTAHGFHFYKGAPKQNWLIYYPIEKWMAKYTDKLITITEEDFQRASQRFKCTTCRMHGVGVDEGRYYPVDDAEKQSLKVGQGFSGPILLNVGELLPNKNQKMAISAMKKIIEQIPDATLLIAGNGSEKDNLETYVNEQGLEDHVRLIGYCTHLEDYQRMSDVLLACSYREGLPLNLVESMLSDTIVVATKNRGHRELVDDGVTGYLVDLNNAEQMAEKAISILQAHTKADQMKQAAHEKGLLYGFKSVTKELKEIYGLTD